MPTGSANTATDTQGTYTFDGLRTQDYRMIDTNNDGVEDTMALVIYGYKVRVTDESFRSRNLMPAKYQVSDAAYTEDFNLILNSGYLMAEDEYDVLLDIADETPGDTLVLAGGTQTGALDVASMVTNKHVALNSKNANADNNSNKNALTKEYTIKGATIAAGSIEFMKNDPAAIYATDGTWTDVVKSVQPNIVATETEDDTVAELPSAEYSTVSFTAETTNGGNVGILTQTKRNITGVIWEDTNNNGLQDGAESADGPEMGLNGYEVELIRSYFDATTSTWVEDTSFPETKIETKHVLYRTINDPIALADYKLGFAQTSEGGKIYNNGIYEFKDLDAAGLLKEDGTIETQPMTPNDTGCV